MVENEHTVSLRTPNGQVRIIFENGPMIRARFTSTDPFFLRLADAWNSRPVGRDDPHSHLLDVIGTEQSKLSKNQQQQLLANFLLAAATALRKLENGRVSECASLEHHALALKNN